MNRPVKSASNAAMWIACPGSGRMQEGLSEPDSEYSAEGSMLHHCYATGVSHSTMTDEQKDALALANDLTERFFTQVREQFGIPEDAEYVDIIEQEMWFPNHLFPGHPDKVRIWVHHAVAAVADAKFGFLQVEEAPSNTQLAIYALMLNFDTKWPLHHVAIAIIQPRNFGPKFSSAAYSVDDLKGVYRLIETAYVATQKHDAPRIPGSHCTYCRAKTICPEYRATLAQIDTVGTRAISTVPNEQLVYLHRAIKLADKIRDEVSDEMRSRIEAGALPGWTLKNTGSVRTVRDPIGMFHAFADTLLPHGATVEQRREFAQQYDACRDMGWSKLEALVARVAGLSEKRAKEQVRAIAAPFVSEEPKAKSPREGK